MSSLTDADSLAVGSSAVNKLYMGATQIWPKTSTLVTLSGTPTTGTAASSTAVTITLPSYVSGDYLLLAVSRNQADGSAWRGDSNATVTELVNVSRRLSLVTVQPVGAASSFVLTANTTALWSWCCLNLGNITPSVQTVTNAIGNSTTSSLEFNAVTASPATDGNQLAIALAGTNSTAVWTAPSGTTLRYSNASSPGLLVGTYTPASGLSTISTTNADRGNNGTSRFEASIVALVRA